MIDLSYLRLCHFFMLGSCLILSSCEGYPAGYVGQPAGPTPWARSANSGRYQRVHQPAYVQRQQYLNATPPGTRTQSGREPGERELEAIFGLINTSDRYKPKSTQPGGPTCEICGEPAVVSGRWCGPHAAAIGQQIQQRGY